MKGKAEISVVRDVSPGTRVSLTIQFDPEERGAERTQAIWEGIGKVIKAALNPDEIPEFLRQLEQAKQKALSGGAQ